MSLSTKIFIGLILGIITGLFFGELVADWKIVGDLYVKFLQVTVLPYIVVSLISGFAKLNMGQVSMLAVRGSLILVAIWVITILTIYAFSFSFPHLETAAFFSSSSFQPQENIDLFELFVPANIFYSLGHSMVPAVVLFSLLLGISLISVADKELVIRVFDALGDGLTTINETVVKATPIGIYFIAASAAGTLTIEEISRVQVYLVSYICLATLVTFWIFPALISSLSGIPYKDILVTFKDALVTAFATGNQFVVLPLIAENCKTLLRNYYPDHGDTEDSAVDVIVPISFNFPSLGKLLVILFVMFAAWFNNIDVTITEYLLLAVSGVFSLFGSIHVAVPYMLNTLQIPNDMYQLFIVTGVVVGRFGAMLAALHIVCIGLLGTLALTGKIELKMHAVLAYVGISAGIILGLVLGLQGYFKLFTPETPERTTILGEATEMVERVPTTLLYQAGQGTLQNPEQSRLEQIQQQRVLRVGYRAENLPCTFVTEEQKLVGFDVEMMQFLAEDLGVALEFVPFEITEMGSMLTRGQMDIAVSCLASLPDRNLDAAFTRPYLDLKLGVIVKDHDLATFSDPDSLRALPDFTVATVASHYFEARLRRLYPNAKTIVLDSANDFFTTDTGADALLLSVEEGSAYTYRYPLYSVFEAPRKVTVPAVMVIPQGDYELTGYLDNWIRLKQGDGTLHDLYDYWMLGGIAKKKQPRWSIAKDVLGWVE